MTLKITRKNTEVTLKMFTKETTLIIVLNYFLFLFKDTEMCSVTHVPRIFSLTLDFQSDFKCDNSIVHTSPILCKYPSATTTVLSVTNGSISARTFAASSWKYSRGTSVGHQNVIFFLISSHILGVSSPLKEKWRNRKII